MQGGTVVRVVSALASLLSLLAAEEAAKGKK
jgi:hypothetical protein